MGFGGKLMWVLLLFLIAIPFYAWKADQLPEILADSIRDPWWRIHQLEEKLEKIIDEHRGEVRRLIGVE
jgi:hypothetical protein